MSCSITQVMAIDSVVYPVFKSWYWVSSAITIGLGIHCMLTTSMLLVFGPGLALRGPLGSMVRAIEGLVDEQQGVLWSYILCVLCFGTKSALKSFIFICCNCTLFVDTGIATAGTFWLMMYQVEAIICNGIMLIAMYYWYDGSIRIYNRFKWEEQGSDWGAANPEDRETNPKDSDGPDAPGGKQAGYVPPVAGGMKRKSGNGTASESDSEAISNKPMLGPGSIGIHKQGYITLFDSSATFSSSSKRCYAVLTTNSSLWYYATKRAYDDTPKSPVKNRPVAIEDWTPKVTCTNPPTLTLKRTSPTSKAKQLEFRFDTFEELNKWMQAFLDVGAGSDVVEQPSLVV